MESESSAALIRNGKVEPLTLGEDAIFNTRIDLAPEVEAPVVFWPGGEGRLLARASFHGRPVYWLASGV